ncbi:ATP-grasp domain-containing protein [Streptomyces sp. NPDC048717]|uniref:ATP-grasp domain-containing protein n=1 Tax=Streptomyces sp. NPDC048717 TaxID=3154928 RepID=UPI0034372068
MTVEVLPAPSRDGAVAVDGGGRSGGHYYGGPAFGARVVDALGVALLEPSDDWLTSLPLAYTGRRITLATLGEARRLTRPAFVKPPSDKSFPAAVYADGGRLPVRPELPPDLPVQIADVVTWAAEFRLFVLDGEVRAGSQYATFGRLDARPLDGHRQEDAVREFAAGLLTACGDGLPSAVVVDVGLLTPAEPGGSGHSAGDQCAVVEANMAWFSNCYAADPNRALDVVLRAAGPRARLAERDRRFCRHL